MTSRRVLITGASRGIGFAVARELADTGHRPIGMARSESQPFPGQFYSVDLADRAATAAALEAILQDGPVDAVVNNVGMNKNAAFGEVDLDDLAELYDFHVRVAFQVAQAALPGMRANGWGRIVNVSSMATLGLPIRSAYAASKAALDACTRVWAGELGASGITVNSVAPGFTETELFRRNAPRGSETEIQRLASIPVNRFGEPREIAAAICFLLSAEADYITGQTLHVDGGGSIPAA
jgi:NAD(P)-dependent dehydrogenase (short-subunit alcohol dehydrogenase family)